MKISTFVVAILCVGLFSTVLGIYYADLSAQYSQDYNATSFAGYDQFTTINDNLAEINRTLTTLEQESGITDLLGGFLASGFNVLKITFKSFGAFFSMIAHTFTETTVLGQGWAVFKTYLVAIAFTLFIFGVVAVLVGRDI